MKLDISKSLYSQLQVQVRCPVSTRDGKNFLKMYPCDQESEQCAIEILSEQDIADIPIGQDDALMCLG